MKVAVCGVTPGGLTACASLIREGHEVVLLGTHEANEPELLQGDLGVLERRGLFGAVPTESLGAEPLDCRRFLFSDGEEFAGFSGDVPGDRPVLVNRGKLIDWLLERVRNTKVRDRSEAEATGLLRQNDAVRGVWTDQGALEADAVYLAEGNFSWLTRHEGYHRTLPGENPEYLLDVRKHYSDPDGTNPAPASDLRTGGPGTVTTVLLTPYPSEQPLNVLLRLTGGQKRLVVNLLVPYEGFRQVRTSVDELMDWAQSLPFLDGLPRRSNTPPPETSLRLPGGRTRWASLRDHGLAVGGEGAGTASALPGSDALGPSLYSAYQFSRAVSHLERSGEPVSRESLRKYYVRPLEESPYGRRARRADPWVDAFLEEDGELPGAVRALVTGTLGTKWDFGAITETLKQLQPEEWSLPDLPSLPSLGRELSGQLFASVAMDADQSLLFSGEAGWGTRVLVRWLRERMGYGETSGGDPADEETPVRAVSVLEVLGSLAPESCSNGAVADRRTGSRTDDSTSLPVFGEGPDFLTTVGSSLNDGVEPFEDLEVACPAGVFELRGDPGDRTFTESPERCTECGVCRFGPPGIDFMGVNEGILPGGRNDTKSENILESLHGFVPSGLEEPAREVLGRTRSRLRSVAETLATTSFLTPDARRWIQGQLNLVRGDVRDLDESGEGFERYRRELLDVLHRTRRALSRGQYRYTRQLLHRMAEFYLPLSPWRSETDESVNGDSPVSTGTDTDPQPVAKRVRELADRLDDRLREILGSRPGKRRVALVVPGRREELVAVVEPHVEELVVLQEGGHWTVETRELTLVRSHEVAEDLRVRRYTLPEENRRPNGSALELDYRASVEPFAGVLVGVHRQLLSDLTEVLEPGQSSGRSTGPDELLPIGYLEVHREYLRVRRNHDGSDPNSVLLDLLGLQETLLGPDFGGLESVSHLLEESVSDDLPGEVLPFLELFFGSIGELAEEVLDRGLASVGDPDPLGLSPEERERWEEGDTGGVVDDSVRQWRTALGELRQLADDSAVSPQELGVFVGRLRTTRHLIEDVQKKLSNGASPRLETLLLDLAMRRLYRSRQPLGPVNTHPLKTSGDSRVAPPSDSSLRQKSNTLKKSFGKKDTFTEGPNRSQEGSGLYGTVLDSVLGRIGEGSSVADRRVIVLLAEIRSLRIGNEDPEDSLETFGLGRMLRIHQHLGRFLSTGRDFVGAGIEDDPGTLWRSTAVRLRKQFVEELYEESFERRVRGLTRRYRDDLPVAAEYFEEESELESLERSLELFSGRVAKNLQRRVNLASLYDQYVRMLAELHRLEVGGGRPPGLDELDDWIRGKLIERSRNVLRSTSSLFVHGVRDVTDGIEPPEAQVLDLLEPETVFERRYRSLR